MVVGINSLITLCIKVVFIFLWGGGGYKCGESGARHNKLGITVASLAPRELCKRFLPSFLLEGGRSGWPEEASGSPAIV